MAEIERIPLQRAVAIVQADAVHVKPSRGQLVNASIQLAIALGAVLAIVAFFDRLPLWALGVLLALAILLGPIAALGFVYSLIGSYVVVDRRRGAARWQQGLLGLGIGTTEYVPFPRIARVQVAGDYEATLGEGERQDLVTWDVEVVRDDEERLEIGSIVVARPLADEGLARANRLATAVAAVAAVEAETGELPAAASEVRAATPGRVRRRRRSATALPPPGETGG